jgi:transposase-like protein
MSEVQKPSCPLCKREMPLKNVFRQQPFDHYVFKCASCGLEYPVLKKADAMTLNQRDHVVR